MTSKRRIPGMLYITFSFTPWMAYWVLCELYGGVGVLVALAASLLLAAYGVARRSPSVMDLASASYFTVAAIATFTAGSRVFVEESGILGYLALSLMALTSIVFKHPFTLQASKRDYPEVYWRDERFIAVNNVITGIWAAVFLVNALVHLALAKPLSSIASNTLIALGVASSMVIPSRLVAYTAVREFKRYDWRAPVSPGMARGGDEYDVVVVGSGIGGLTCASLLSKRGFKVLVLEQHYRVGGYCSSFTRKGFTFNAGVENVSGLWEKGPVTYLLRELGLRREDLFVRNRLRLVYKGLEVEFTGLDEFLEGMTEAFPGESEPLRSFLDEARAAYEECYREAELYGTPLPPWLIVKVLGPEKLLDYPREHPHFYDWMNKTFKQKLDEYFEDEDLKALLCGLIGYVGAPPDKITASTGLVSSLSYYMYGGYFPRGGAQRFADTLKEYIESHGGEVLVRHRVDGIIVEGGVVRGVRARGRVFRSPVVVANANAKTALLELVGEEHLGRSYARYIKRLKMSPSCFMVYLGVDMDLTGYPTIIEGLDEGLSILIASNADPSLAPSSRASVSIIAPASYHDFPERGSEGYSRVKWETARSLVRRAEKVVPGLSSHVVVMDAATPKTFERYTSMPEGALYAFDQSIETRRPYFKTPVRGLYLASASTFPGGGVEAAVIAGIICANDICDWRQ